MSSKTKNSIFVLILLIAITVPVILGGGPVFAIVPFLLPLFLGGVIIAGVIVHSIDSKTAKTPSLPLTDVERRRFNTIRILIILAVITFFVVSSLV